MAVSKRVRYEVLRRDNHSCRYCGGMAPDVVLTIDHVVPVALGGTDEPTNLVTACRDCNAGKTSTAPDSGIVEDVRADALRWAAAVRQAAIEQQERHSVRREAFDAVANAWHEFRRTMPSDWETSIGQFLDAGLPTNVIVEMVGVANRMRGVNDRWGYFCGCCWTRARQLQDRALEIVSTDDHDNTEQGLTVYQIAEYDVPDLWLLTLYGLAKSGHGELPPCACGRDTPGAPFCGDIACMLKVTVLAARDWSDTTYSRLAADREGDGDGS